MTSQNLKFVDSPKTQRCKSLENEILYFFSNKKISFIIHSRLSCGNSEVIQNPVLKSNIGKRKKTTADRF